MTRRDLSFLMLGVTAGAIATVFATESARHALLASAVYTWESLPVEKMRNAGDGQASYFVLRWTSPGKEGPKPGGSR